MRLKYTGDPPTPGSLACEKMPFMSDAPKPAPTRTTGLSPKEQKLQALRAKAAQKLTGAKPGSEAAGASAASFKAKNSFAGKKTAFQRKAT